jgi:hypothetical protein
VKPKTVWSHDWATPIGRTLEGRELMPGDDLLPADLKAAGLGGLWIRGQFNLDKQVARDALADVVFYGSEGSWSIGYDVSPGGAQMTNSAL